MEEKEKYELPKISPKYLNDNNLWDSIWLMKKYPDNHLKNTEHLLGKSEIGRVSEENPELL